MKQAQKIGIRQFRANLKKYLDAGEPLVITNGYRKVAVLLPTGLDAWAQAKDEQASCSRMRKMITDQVQPAIWGDWR